MKKYLEIRNKLFYKILYRLYICNDSSQLVVYNLKLHTIAYLEDLSAELFILMHKCTNIELEKFLKDNKLEEEFEDFVEILIMLIKNRKI